MYKALEIEFIITRKIIIETTKGSKECVRIIRIVLD